LELKKILIAPNEGAGGTLQFSQAQSCLGHDSSLRNITIDIIKHVQKKF